MIFAIIAVVIIIALLVATFELYEFKWFLGIITGVVVVLAILALIVFCPIQIKDYTPYETQEVVTYYVQGEVFIDGYLMIENSLGEIKQEYPDKISVVKYENLDESEKNKDLDKIVINKVRAKCGIFTTSYNEAIIYK